MPRSRLCFIGLFYRDFLHATLMPAAFKCCFKEHVKDFPGRLVVDETTRKHNDIGIIVLTY